MKRFEELTQAQQEKAYGQAKEKLIDLLLYDDVVFDHTNATGRYMNDVVSEAIMKSENSDVEVAEKIISSKLGEYLHPYVEAAALNTFYLEDGENAAFIEDLDT